MAKNGTPKFPTPHVRSVKEPIRPPSPQEMELVIANVVQRLSLLTRESVILIALVPGSGGTEIVSGGQTRSPEEARAMLQKALDSVPKAEETIIKS